MAHHDDVAGRVHGEVRGLVQAAVAVALAPLVAPVVTGDQLGSQYLFGKRDIFRTIAFLVVVLVVYFLVFTHQEPILAFLAHAGWYAEAAAGTFLARFPWMSKMIVSLAVFLFVPVVAYSYGTVTRALLKLIKME